MRIDFSNDSVKTVSKLDTNTAGRIMKGIINLPDRGDIKALDGFDYISPEDGDRIKKAHEEMQSGDCVSFNSPEEMLEYFGLKDVVNALENRQ